MKIEHVALYVKDLEVSKDFYVNYFCAKCGDKYTNIKGFSSYFLSFNEGARLELMSLNNICEKNNPLAYGYSHIAISVGSKKLVNELTDKLFTDGFTVKSYPRTTGDGYYESVVCDPDGNYIEITI